MGPGSITENPTEPGLRSGPGRLLFFAAGCPRGALDAHPPPRDSIAVIQRLQVCGGVMLTAISPMDE
jgi:hypothetical protein